MDKNTSTGDNFPDPSVQFNDASGNGNHLTAKPDASRNLAYSTDVGSLGLGSLVSSRYLAPGTTGGTADHAFRNGDGTVSNP